MKLNRKNKKGFTIVELVIVIAVIGILAAILIPTFTNLTKNAQETAKKQQVSDAYTLYLSEAVDGKYDNLYELKETKYVDANVAIANKQQVQVALKLNGEWFTYEQDKGWNVHDFGSDPVPSTLVCNPFKAGDKEAGKKFYEYNSETKEYSEKFVLAAEATDAKLLEANEKASTFNSVLVYVL